MKNQHQIKAMLRNAYRVAVARAEQAEKSGAVNPEAPHFCKAIVCAALRSTALDYVPLTAEGKADVKNLTHFV